MLCSNDNRGLTRQSKVPHTPTHTHTHTHTCALKHTHTYTHARTHARTHTHTQALTDARTHTYTHAHTYARTHAHTHTHTRTHTHTHAHTLQNKNAEGNKTINLTENPMTHQERIHVYQDKQNKQENNNSTGLVLNWVRLETTELFRSLH